MTQSALMPAQPTRRRFIAVTAAALAAGGVKAGTWTRQTWRGRTLGADARITLEGPPDQIADALRAAVAALRRVESLYSLHDAKSTLSHLNAAGRLAAPPADFLALLRLCARVHRETGGQFDPTVQPLWRALYEGATAARIAQARASIGWGRVRVETGAVVLGEGQALTLNGIAQGAAADAVVSVLAAHGVGHALVDTGETRALGGPWRMGIHDAATDTVATRQLRNAAMATSSPGALSIGQESHILSPTGTAQPSWSTVSVEATGAAVADAVSTAAVLMPAAALQGIVDRMPEIQRVVAIDRQGNVSAFA